MAEELGYSSRSDFKRKYDDSDTPPPRRQSGFSSAPTQDKAPSQSYNNVPPPMDEIEAAKQRAQAIAAKLFSDAEAKRPKTDNGSDLAYLSKFTSQPLPPPQASTTSFASYNYHGSSKKIDIPNGRVGVIIGKGGDTIKYLQVQSGAKIQVTRDMDADPNSPTRTVEIQGTPEQIAKAEELIAEVLAQADAGVSDIVSSRRVGGPAQTGGETYQIKIGNNKVGLVIGKGGETIKSMQAKSGARIQVIPLHLPPGDTSTERTVYVDGTEEQIEVAKQLLNEILSETRIRNPSGGGYRAPRPQSNTWPPPPSQPSYNNYMQPTSAYPGAPQPQYNMPQPQYPGYPPSSYQTGGWDQSSNQSAQPQQPAPGGYDYYNQQQHQVPQPDQSQPTGASTVPPTSTDPTGYSYAQPPSYTSQGTYGDASAYSSGYSQGYSQPQAQAGYNYSAATSYTTPTKTSSQDGSASNYTAQGGTTTNSTPPQASPAQQTPSSGAPSSQQGYLSQPPMTTPTSYPTQGYPPVPSQPGYSSSQPGYGLAAAYVQRPPPPQPVYGQTPPTGSAQTGYAQPGYPQGQAAPPQSGYGTGYGGYGQYSESSYGGGGAYGQVPAPAYSKDGTAAPGSGSGAPGGVAQAAPGGGAPVAAGSKTPPS
ncbi:far upstream element-binding protein 2-like protein [Carex littledalei]|uniref:Far upstream element-binding protein 2-like protein n=1 Tax=Carex littledalei TaxID=544730 RepID=A0A833R595_9POAL|nr:far upstream element-binding protein 2-like protein [Carex littledalei]